MIKVECKVGLDAGLNFTLGFNADQQNRDSGCKFPRKVQPESPFGAFIFYLRIRPQHQKFHELNPAWVTG